jgi:ankyrin repeat protein
MTTGKRIIGGLFGLVALSAGVLWLAEHVVLAQHLTLDLSGVPGRKVVGTVAIDGITHDLDDLLPAKIEYRGRRMAYSVALVDAKPGEQITVKTHVGANLLSECVGSGARGTVVVRSRASGSTEGWIVPLTAREVVHLIELKEFKSLQRDFLQPSAFYPDGNSGQLNLLVMCIDRGDVGVLEQLVKAAPKLVNVNEGGSKCSPVHWAAFKGDTEILAVLIKSGAIIQKPGTPYEITPLHVARDAKTAEFLLSEGANIESQAIYAQTPLMWAARRGNLEVAQCLLQCGAKINCKDEGGRTALYFAESTGHTKVAAYLISKGAVPLTEKEKADLPAEIVAGFWGDPGHPFATTKLLFGSAENPERNDPP